MPKIVSAFLLMVCVSIAMAADDKPLVVYTTFYPLTYFTEAIGGAHVKVVNPLPETEDGAFWVPPREIVKQYHAADLIVMNGSNYEQGFGKVSLPESKVVNATAFLKGNEVILEDPVTHSHGTAGMHTHQGMDGHTWVDPQNAKREAQTICDALSEKRPAFANEFKTNLTALDGRFDELDRLMKETVAPAAKGQQLFASHPAYNYLARSYGLTIKSFHMDPNETPAPEEIAAIEKFIKEHPARVILWEDSPRAETEKLMREKFALTSVVFSPCEGLSKEDGKAGRGYFEVMKQNIASLSKHWRRK